MCVEVVIKKVYNKIEALSIRFLIYKVKGDITMCKYSDQPSSLPEILKKRPQNRSEAKTPDNLRDRLMAAFLGRCAGCTLGVPVENWQIADMKRLAEEGKMEFPPKDYWTVVSNPDGIQYGINKRSEYTRSGIRFVPVDDDITYTLLNLLLLEKYGKGYSVEDTGELWLDVLPYACTAEDEALKQLRAGTAPMHAADYNDYVEWIGAAIRADAFGYAMAGDPEGAAVLSYNDAYLTHRKNGIYGEMFAAASVAAAFTAKTPLDAVRIGMQQIPEESELYSALVWALSYEGRLTDYKMANELLKAKFDGMHCVHTINNMCAVVFALILGGDDFTSCISNSIAIGYDNDCNGATVGSIVGACLGLSKIPEYWYRNFNGRVASYIKGYPMMDIEDVVDRFVSLNG